MTRDVPEELRVIAIDPVSRGFGWAVLEGPHRLIDWGVKYSSGGHRNAWLQGLAELLDHFDPQLLVVEDTAASGTRRCARVQKLIARALRLATALHIRVCRVPRQKVREVFTGLGASTKHEVAATIAKRFPELDPRLPPLRKPWMSEDDRMSIFDALAFALTALGSETSRKQGTPHAA